MQDPVEPVETRQHRRFAPRIRQIPVRMILPNLITVIAICAGLSGIRLAFENRFEIAVIMVLIAAFLDGIDGRVARMLKATSRFGAEMDSLADIVYFGAAPALVLYAFLLDRAGAVGWIAALLFAIACGLRLARFNIQHDDPNRPAWRADYFTGVPAPAGALLVMLPVYLGFLGMPLGASVAYGASVYTVVIAFLLVSTLPVFSGKTSGTRVRGDAVMPLILAVAGYVLVLTSFTWQTMTVTAVAYLLFQPFSVRMYAARLKKDEQHAAEAAANPEPRQAGEPPTA